MFSLLRERVAYSWCDVCALYIFPWFFFSFFFLPFSYALRSGGNQLQHILAQPFVQNHNWFECNCATAVGYSFIKWHGGKRNFPIYTNKSFSTRHALCRFAFSSWMGTYVANWWRIINARRSYTISVLNSYMNALDYVEYCFSVQTLHTYIVLIMFLLY